MPVTPVVSGPNFQQVDASTLTIQLTGTTQDTLANLLSTDPCYATYYFTGTPAATNQVFFLATRALKIVAMSCVFSTAAGGASTLTVTKDTSTNAPGAGTAVQTGSFNLNATANTVQTATLAALATITMAAGDRLAVVFANAIQATAGLVISVQLAAP